MRHVGVGTAAWSRRCPMGGTDYGGNGAEMNKYEMVMFIIFIVFATGALKHYISARHNTPKIDDETKDRLARLDALEERVQVLEKIVTDRNYDLKQQFRDL